MPRPSLKAERTEQIFNAFLRCVARYGVDGASLERVAEEAQLQRSMIRHFVGNRDVLINGLAERLTQSFASQMQRLLHALPKEQPAEVFVEWLFDPDYSSDADTILALEALIAVAPRYAAVNDTIKTWYADTIDQFTAVMQKAQPRADEQACREVAVGIVGIYFNTDAMMPLKMPDSYRLNGRAAALRLLHSLDLS